MEENARLVEAIRENWRREVETAHAYRLLAERERDSHVRGILSRLADVEDRHARQWADKLVSLGADAPEADAAREGVRSWLTAAVERNAALRKLEADEVRFARLYEQQLAGLADAETLDLLHRMQREEDEHAVTLRAIHQQGRDPRTVLDTLMKRERWHASGGSWVGGAIYGVNDGLGAVFGIVSGVSGYSNGGHIVLISGLAGMLASALSMGSGAYLAAKAEREIREAQLDREKAEIEASPEEEREELALFYQLKGFSAEEAHRVTDRIANNPAQFLETLAAEELGFSPSQFPRPITAAASASLSTAVGAFIPIIPFFFWDGTPAIIAAAIVSLVAHFGVGVGKALIFGLRSWMRAGVEMTAIGAAEGVVTFLIGVWGAHLLAR